MPHGIIWFPLTAMLVTVVLLLVVRKKPRK
jgi:hypothetical protein